MKKKLKKLSKIVLIIMLILAMDISLVLNCVQATEGNKEHLYRIDYCEKVLKYQGIPRGSVYVVYEENGEEYPAYCVNPNTDGVGEAGAYDVSVDSYITDVFLWRIVTNGYPYKTLEELGVANKKEAYLATKQAIYCYLDNRNINEFAPIGEAGERTLNALKQIWNNANNSTETKISNKVDVVSIEQEWKQDNLNSQYISKSYKIEAPAPMQNYEVEIKGDNIPKGLKVTNKENKENKIFGKNEEFKILIPVIELNKAGGFEIEIKTKMNTKPVLYGYSGTTELQSYALTTLKYEDSTGTYNEQYPKNEAKITIIKQEKDTNKLLEGVEFQLLDSKEKEVYQSLITNEKGEIVIKNILPGKYYLKEVRALEGYVPYNEKIEIDVHVNEQINVTVNNSKEKNIEVSKDVTNIEVEATKENIKEVTNEKNVKKLPKTGM